MIVNFLSSSLENSPPAWFGCKTKQSADCEDVKSLSLYGLCGSRIFHRWKKFVREAITVKQCLGKLVVRVAPPGKALLCATFILAYEKGTPKQTLSFLCLAYSLVMTLALNKKHFVHELACSKTISYEARGIGFQKKVDIARKLTNEINLRIFLQEFFLLNCFTVSFFCEELVKFDK